MSLSTTLFSSLVRKRPPPDFHSSGGERERHEGFSKKGRFQDEGDDDVAVPPATLRILVRNQDAGGIIGKVRRECGECVCLSVCVCGV